MRRVESGRQSMVHARSGEHDATSHVNMKIQLFHNCALTAHITLSCENSQVRAGAWGFEIYLLQKILFKI